MGKKPQLQFVSRGVGVGVGVLLCGKGARGVGALRNFTHLAPERVNGRVFQKERSIPRQ